MPATTETTDLRGTAPKGDRLRVLVIAEAANPEWVSVPLVGWSIAMALRAHHDVHIVTQVRNRDAILRAGLVEGEDFSAIDSEAVARRVHRLSEVLRMGEGKGWTILTALSSRLSYPYFERLIWKRFGPAIRAGAYDIVHRVTPVSPSANSSLAAKCARHGVPFILGPLNGGVAWPKGFRAEQRRENEWLSSLRGVYKLSAARTRMLRNTAAIICGSRTAAREIPARMQGRVTLIPENAVDPERFNRSAQPGTEGPLRCCFVGRLVPLKGPDMLLDAAAPYIRDGRLVLDIVGSGPIEHSLADQARQLGIEAGVTFHGWVAHRRVQDILVRSDLFTFPSIREFGGGAILEAMALGVVPLVCDYAGPGELVDEATGYKVPVEDRASLVRSLRRTLGHILENRDELPAKSQAARRKVSDYFTWDRKAGQIGEIYRWALSPDGPIPQPVPLS